MASRYRWHPAGAVLLLSVFTASLVRGQEAPPAVQETDAAQVEKVRQAEQRLAQGQQAAAAGNLAKACEHYSAAIRDEPALFGRDPYSIQQTFRQAGKTADLVALMKEIDLQRMGQVWPVSELIRELLEGDQTRKDGLELLAKGWDAFPTQRQSLLGSIYSDTAWQLPEMLPYARQVLEPTAEQIQLEPWVGIGEVMIFYGDGRAGGLLTRVVQCVEQHGARAEVIAQLETTLAASPDWHGGRAVLAVLHARAGATDKAREMLEPLLEIKEPPIPSRSAWLIGQEIDEIADLQPIAVRLYEGAMESSRREPGNGIRYSPMPRLVRLYEQAGQRDRARRMLLGFAAEPRRPEQYNPGYGEYRYLEDQDAIGGELLRMGFAIDAMQIYQRALADQAALAAAERWGGSMRQQLERGLQNATAALTPEAYAQSLLALTSPDAAPAKEAAGPAIDLMLSVQPADLTRAEVTSLFQQAVATVAEHQPEALRQVADNLRVLGERLPQDLSVTAAAGIVAFAGEDEDAMRAACERAAAAAGSVEASEESPTDPPLARIGLWLVAREAWRREATRDLGDRIADAALEGARREANALWALAMLRERGARALEAGDREAAERAWSEMLDRILAAPLRGETAAADGGNANLAEKTGRLLDTFLGGLAGQPESPGDTGIGVDQFLAAMQVARLAAENEMPDLSLRAVRESFAQGPPVFRSGGGRATPVTAGQVEPPLAEISRIWKRTDVGAARAYEVLASVVLPESQGGVQIYAVPLAESGLQQPRSVGWLLVEWAVAAEQTDALTAAVAARANAALQGASVEVLRGQVAQLRGDDDSVASALEALAALLKQSADINTAELACHVAIPALAEAETADAAVAVLDLALEVLSRQDGEEPAASLALMLARAHFDDDRVEQGRAALDRYLEATQRMNVRYGDEYGLFRRKQQLQRVAQELLRAGDVEAALQRLAEESDIVLTQNYGGASGAPTTASLARIMARQPAEARYRALHTWVAPRPNRRTVRIVTEFVPQDVPPAVFATALGLEPDDSAFPRPGFGAVGDLFCSATALVEAAREAGQLERLAAECEAWVAQEVQDADFLMLLVYIAQDRTDKALPRLQSFAAEMQQNLPAQGENRPIDLKQLVLAHAAAASPPLRELAVEMLNTLVTHSQRIQNGAIRPHLRRALAVAQVLSAGSDPALLDDDGLALWAPASQWTAGIHAGGGVPATWVAHEGHVTHVAGPYAQYLFFAYPLTGSFDVTADVFDGGWAEGGFGFGGIVGETFAYNKTGEVFAIGQHGRVRQPAPSAKRGFNRYTFQVRPGSLRLLINGSLYHDAGPPNAASPWLALYGNRERQPVFRDIHITGTPEIPREVALVGGDNLLGWTSHYYAETQPAVFGTPARIGDAGWAYDAGIPDGGYDWLAESGVIRGRRATGPQAQAVPSLLQQFRPLRDGESLEYEFLYMPGEIVVHPAIGRIVFLVEPEGIRLHWLTDGPDREWTGLPTDNAVAVPEERRGPEMLPLLPGEWNRIVVAVEGGIARIDLNGTQVYEHRLDPSAERIFGFFHYKDRSAVEVRGVTLRGDWPVTLAPEQLADLIGPLTPEAAQVDRRALAAFVGEEQVAEYAGTVYRQALAMPAEARYDYLARFVLPNDEHPTFRLYGNFTPTYPAPPVDPTLRQRGSADEQAAEEGGTLIAPAALLVETAQELDRLDELYARINEVPAIEQDRLRPQLALLAMVRMAQRNYVEAQRHLEEVLALVLMMPKTTATHLRWDALVAATEAIEHARLRQSALDMLDLMVKQTQEASLGDQWHRWVRHTRAVAREISRMEEMGVEWGDDPQLVHWMPAIHTTAYSAGQGLPRPHWTVADGELKHFPGHARDYLYLRTPLRGDFEVQCQLSGFGWREAFLAYGGIRLGLQYDRKRFELDRYGWFLPEGTIDPPLDPIGPFYDYRIVVRGDRSEHYINGRKIHEQVLSPVVDPWLGIHAFAFCDAAVRDFRITGNPTVPEVLHLSANPELIGWKADYYAESIGNADSDWQKQGAEIVGVRRPEAAGTMQESLLRYHRPMAEDGEIEYEFLYQPGAAMTHPVLDRLVFLLEPEGVKVHWLTDAGHERTGLTPGNVYEEPEHRRSEGDLPLIPGDWNRMRCALRGDTVTLELNGQTIYERPLEETNQRLFGLFHYKDATEVRVRHVTWRGDWPKELPQTEDWFETQSADRGP